MNQTPETLQKDGVLEITVKKGTMPEEHHKIDAYRINGNGHWRYIRSNGQILAKQVNSNPEEMAHAIKLAYFKKNLSGEVYWSYNKQKS